MKSPKIKIAENHAEMNIIEKKDHRNEYCRNRDRWMKIADIKIAEFFRWFIRKIFVRTITFLICFWRYTIYIKRYWDVCLRLSVMVVDSHFVENQMEETLIVESYIVDMILDRKFYRRFSAICASAMWLSAKSIFTCPPTRYTYYSMYNYWWTTLETIDRWLASFQYRFTHTCEYY